MKRALFLIAAALAAAVVPGCGKAAGEKAAEIKRDEEYAKWRDEEYAKWRKAVDAAHENWRDRNGFTEAGK